MSFVLLLPIGFIAVFIAIVLAFVGMRKDAQQRKDAARRIYKRMKTFMAVGIISLVLGLFGLSREDELMDKAASVTEVDEAIVFTTEKLTELEKNLLTDYHDNFSMTTWYQKELKLEISKGDQGYYKLSLHTEMPESEESKKIADKLTHPFFGLVNANGAMLQGQVDMIEVYGKGDKLLMSVKNPLSK